MRAMEDNPFREADLSLRNHPESCVLVIFGATGDLTHRKLIPALYNLAADGDLSALLAGKSRTKSFAKV